MAEFIGTKYERLFEVRLLHHYFLDRGQTDFTALAPDQQTKMLSAYDCRQFLSFTPSATTAQILQGLGCRFCTLPTGFMVVAPGHRVIPQQAILDFTVTIRDDQFFNYTALTLLPRKIYEIEKEGRVFRFKENVFLFSNGSGTQAGNGKLYLSKPIPLFDNAASYPVETLLIDNNSQLVQLTGDYPPANGTVFQVLGPAGDLPLFVNTADVPVITPPPGLNGAPTHGIELRDEWPRDLFALIRIAAKHANNDAFSLSDSNGAFSSPVFELHFKNRSTRWRYFKRTDQSAITEEPAPLPLTFSGNAGARQKPSAGLVKAEYDTPATKRIVQLVSEIFE